MKERVSALLDGALDEDLSVRVLDSLKRDRALRQDWQKYCLIGDALRGSASLAQDISHKVMLEIEDEPTILAPSKPRPSGQGFMHHLMPIAASLVGVAAVGWVANTLNVARTDGIHLASLGKATTVASAPVATAPNALLVPVAVAADTSEQEYLFAHQTLAPSAAMPGVVLYARTVAEVPGQR